MIKSNEKFLSSLDEILATHLKAYEAEESLITNTDFYITRTNFYSEFIKNTVIFFNDYKHSISSDLIPKECEIRLGVTDAILRMDAAINTLELNFSFVVLKGSLNITCFALAASHFCHEWISNTSSTTLPPTSIECYTLFETPEGILEDTSKLSQSSAKILLKPGSSYEEAMVQIFATLVFVAKSSNYMNVSLENDISYRIVFTVELPSGSAGN